MGAWNDLKADAFREAIAEAAPSDFASEDAIVDPVRFASAKREVATRLLPLVAKNVRDLSGEAVFLDKVAGEAALAGRLQQALPLAYWFLFYRDTASRPAGGLNLDADRRDQYDKDCTRAVRALAAVAPELVGETSAPAVAASFRTVESKPLTIGGQKAEPFSFEIT